MFKSPIMIKILSMLALVFLRYIKTDWEESK